MLRPRVIAWNRVANDDRQKLISEALGRSGADAGTALADLVRRLELPQKLRDVGVRREDFSAIAEKVLHDFAIRGNPRPVTAPAQVMEILDLAW